MLLVLKSQQKEIVAWLATLTAKTEQWYLCEAGTGFLSENGLWVPLLHDPLDVEIPEFIQEFVPGAESHDITGYRMFERVTRPSQVEPSSFVTSVVLGGQWALDRLSQAFDLSGQAACNLGTALSVKKVRTALKTIAFSSSPGDTLWKALSYLAQAGDAFRHLTLGRVDFMLRQLDIVGGLDIVQQQQQQQLQGESPAALSAPDHFQLSGDESQVDVDSADGSNCTEVSDGCYGGSWHESVSRAAARIQAQWRGFACRTWLLDLRGAWPRLRVLYAVLARGRITFDVVLGAHRCRLPGDLARPRRG